MTPDVALRQAIRSYLADMHCSVWGQAITIAPNPDEAVEYIAQLFLAIEERLHDTYAHGNGETLR